MDVGAGALLRVTTLCGPEITIIIMTFCHAIADGLSNVSVLRDMMRALAGGSLRRSGPPPIEEKMPWSSLGPAPTWEADRTMPVLPRVRSAVPTDPGRFRTNIVTVELSREETARLLERCRANHTMVHA
jgi:hypothetical protein